MDKQLKSYKRNHKFDHPFDIEEGKIGRETAAYVKLNKQRDRLLKNIIERPDDEELNDTFDEYSLMTEKNRKNAKVHKERLKQFKAEPDFE